MDTLTDWNPDDFLDHKQSEADKALSVRYFYKSVQDKVATLAEGRPIFKEVVYIDIRIPGERDSAACRPATQADVKRFPEHYRAFKTRTSEDMPEGTPLTEWPLITRSQAEEMAFFNIKTVEQLAAMPDSGDHQFRGIHSLKAEAKKWLDSNKDKQALEKEFSKREQALKDQLAAMQEQLDALSKPKKKVTSKAKPRKTVNASTADQHS